MLYEMPEFDFSGKIKKALKKKKKSNITIIASAVFLSIIFGFISGAVTSTFFYFQFSNYSGKINIEPSLEIKELDQNQEGAIIKSVREASPAVVSIIITKDVPILEQYWKVGPFGIKPEYRQKGVKKQELGGGTGFIVSQDGLVLTNKHVVLDEEADYTVFTNDGTSFLAEVLARDPLQDIAIMKIEQKDSQPFPVVELGDSDKLEPGQTVIAIGNALAEFRNTVSTGVISGLGREITASGGNFVETLQDVIQTDAAINRGNSGGPLLNLKGEVIGINTAMANDAQSIGFAIPINRAKRDIEQIKTIGKIIYPFIGIRYLIINEKVKQEYNLLVDYGALIIEGDSRERAIVPNSPADKAGLKKGDIVLEINNEIISTENTLAKIILKYNPGDEISLKILRDNQEIEIHIILVERPE